VIDDVAGISQAHNYLRQTGQGCEDEGSLVVGFVVWIGLWGGFLGF
jgi:hypothetical protein